MIPVALPDVQVRGGEEATQGLTRDMATELRDVLWNDLDFSRVFRLVPREHYTYISALNPEHIVFRDWASIQAKILVVGDVEMAGDDRVVFNIKVYETETERFVFGRTYGSRKDFIRLMAHRAADEMMKYFGEKPLFASKLAFVSNRDGNKEIYIMDWDGARQTRITRNDTLDILPSWGGDDETLFYTTYRNNNPDLMSFHIYSGKTALIAGKRANFSADWTADGSRMAYVSTRDGNSEIYIRDGAGGVERRLTFSPAIDVSPSWSPNGRELAFVSERSGSAQVYIMDAEGGNVRRITFEGTRHDAPEWSPDGTRIAYTLLMGGGIDIYMYHIPTATITKITERCGRNENPSWSPDGRHLAFASNRGGTYQIYLVDYDGANLRQITRSGENSMPNWQKIRQ